MSRIPEDLEAERKRWRGFARGRPKQVDPAGPGEESVWDYPRPPRLERAKRTVRIEFGGEIVATSRRALRVCETSSPPVYYVPAEDVRMEWLEASTQQSFCEWKGVARYFTLRVAGQESVDAAWSYPNPDSPFEALRDHLAFYPGRVASAWLDAERVRPQAGDFYGGWVTSEIKGPFKGEPGTGHW